LRTRSRAATSPDTPAPPAPVATASSSADRGGEAPAPPQAALEPASEEPRSEEPRSEEPASEEPSSSVSGESGEERVAASLATSPTAAKEADASLPPPALSGVGFLWPVPAAEDTVRVTDIGDEGALAIVSPAGEPFVTAENGVVVFAGDDLAAYGRMVVVRHDGDYTTAYGHAQRLDVAVGDVVRRGQRLGLIGSSGEVTKPQLYFEMRVGSRVVDPRAYLVEAPRLVAQGS
ncbi:MAG: murein hydrolase activator EnvC family protein, partial [Alphaproteobacteria bacterium]